MAALVLSAVALALGLWGLPQGYPDFYGHVDEVGVAASIWNFFRAGTLEPTEFTYPAFYSYLTAAGIALAGLLGLPAGLPESGPFLERLGFLSYVDPGWSALVGRLLSATAHAAGVAVVACTGRAVGGASVGWVSGIFAVAATVPMAYAHHALPDTTTALFAALTLALAWRLADSGAWRHALAAGVTVGWVLATKYNGALCALAVVAAHAEARGGAGVWRRPWRLVAGWRLWAAGAAAVIAAAAASPYLVLAWDHYWGIASIEMSRNAFAAAPTTPWWWVVRGFAVRELLVGGCMLAGVAVALVRRDRFDRLALAALLPALLYIGSWTRQSLHYLLPYYPFLAVLAGRAVVAGLRRVRGVPRLGEVRVAIAVALLLAAPSLWRSATSTAALTRPDTRGLAAAWIEAHVPAGATLATTWLPYAPRIDLVSSRQGLLAHYADRPAWQAQLRRLWAQRPAYHLVNLEAWLSQPVVPPSLRDQVDLDDPETRRAFSRGWRSVDRLQADGVTVLVLPDAVHARYRDTTFVPQQPAPRFRRLMSRAYFERLLSDPRVRHRVTIPEGQTPVRGGAISIYSVAPPSR